MSRHHLSPHRHLAALVLGLSVTLVLGACQSQAAPTPTPAPSPTTAPPTSTPPPTATPVPPTATPEPPTATPVPPTATPVPPTPVPAPVAPPPAAPAPAAPPAAAPPAAPPPAAGGAARGRVVFQQQECARCHGANAAGGTGPNGEEGAKISGLRMSVGDFIAQLRNPTGDMRAFPASRISDADAQALYDFLRTLP